MRYTTHIHLTGWMGHFRFEGEGVHTKFGWTYTRINPLNVSVVNVSADGEFT